MPIAGVSKDLKQYRHRFSAASRAAIKRDIGISRKKLLLFRLRPDYLIFAQRSLCFDIRPIQNRCIFTIATHIVANISTIDVIIRPITNQARKSAIVIRFRRFGGFFGFRLSAVIWQIYLNA